MGKSKQSDTTSGDDDVAGLFRRLGADAGAGYRDFGGERLRPPPPAPPAPPPIPAAAPRPASGTAGAAADPVPATPAPAPAAMAPVPVVRPMPSTRNPAGTVHAPAAAAARTPLQQLFDRLAGQGGAPANESPLRRLRGS